MLLSDSEASRLSMELIGTDRTIRIAAKRLGLMVPASQESRVRALVAENGVMQCEKCEWWRSADVLLPYEDWNHVCEDCRCEI